MAVRQAVTPDAMQGRAAATITFVGMGLTPLARLGRALPDDPEQAGRGPRPAVYPDTP